MRLHRTTTLMLVFLLACIALLGACKKNPPPVEETPSATEMTPPPAPTPEPSPTPAVFSVTSIDLGKAIGADNKISEPATTFGPKDTIYAFLYTAIAGGVLALVVAVARRRLSQTLASTSALVSGSEEARAAVESSSSDNRFAYAPAIAIGVVLVALSW